MSIHDTPGPKGTEKTVMDWSIEPDGIFVTLKRGWAFYDGGPDADHTSACHVTSFETAREARAAVAQKRLERCGCQRCKGEV